MVLDTIQRILAIATPLAVIIGVVIALVQLRNQQRLTPMAGTPPNFAKLGEGCRFAPRCPRVAERCRRGEIAMQEVAAGHQARCVLAGTSR